MFFYGPVLEGKKKHGEKKGRYMLGILTKTVPMFCFIYALAMLSTGSGVQIISSEERKEKLRKEIRETGRKTGENEKKGIYNATFYSF